MKFAPIGPVFPSPQKRGKVLRLCGASLGALLTLAGCTPKPTPPATLAHVKVADTIYLPGKDDKLHPHKVSHNAIDTQIKSGGDPTPALDDVIQLKPKIYPPDARVKSFKDGPKQYTLDLNAAFNDPNFWSQSGEGPTELAVQALVVSAVKVGGDPKKPVKITVEGKPATTFGEYDASDSLSPQKELVATQ